MNKINSTTTLISSYLHSSSVTALSVQSLETSLLPTSTTPLTAFPAAGLPGTVMADVEQPLVVGTSSLPDTLCKKLTNALYVKNLNRKIQIVTESNYTKTSKIYKSRLLTFCLMYNIQAALRDKCAALGYDILN